MKVIASDADDPAYGSSARVVYSVLDGEKIFTVDRHTGKNDNSNTLSPACFSFFLTLIHFKLGDHNSQIDQNVWLIPYN